MNAPLIDLELELLVLTLSLYNNPVVPRNVVQFFIDTLTNFCNDKLAVFWQQKCNECQCNAKNNFQSALNSTSKIFKEKGLMIMPMK